MQLTGATVDGVSYGMVQVTTLAIDRYTGQPSNIKVDDEAGQRPPPELQIPGCGVDIAGISRPGIKKTEGPLAR